MTNVLSFLGVVFAAFCIWLTVRIVNRREKWAIRTAVTTLIVFFPLGALCLLLPAVTTPREASRRSQCWNNLKQIGLALHNYHESYGCFPPAYVANQFGRPMHSWRVLILPYLDQEPLYKNYRFDEPWDGPNNRKLADSILAVYNCPSDEHGGTIKSTMTNYVAIVGPETAWPESGTTSFGDISDGTSSTVLVVEVANSGIHWMEPRDLHVMQMAPTVNAKSGQGISSLHPGGAHALLADGSVRYLNEHFTAEELRAWLTTHAGDESKDF